MKMFKTIQLINPPTSTHRIPEENLGLEYLAAESQNNGHEASVIDCWLENLGIAEATAAILAKSPDIVGISPSMDSWTETETLIKAIREKEFKGKIVLGGVYASFYHQALLASVGEKIDGIISGEADETFQQYVIEEDIRGIQGSIYQQGNNIIRTARSTGIGNLDALPFPFRQHMQFKRKWNIPSHVMGSRGCYGNCSFCSVACYQQFSSLKRWRGRSPQSISDEIRQLRKQGETMIKLVDDNFFSGGDQKRELSFAEIMEKEGQDLKFRLSMRANDVNEEVIGKLKSAGLFAVSVGIESFVPRKLRDYNKGTTVKQNLQALRILKKHGIFTQMGFIMFDPFVTLNEIEEELSYLEKESWAITKGICTRLFAAEGTNITKRLHSKGLGQSLKNGNYQYDIIDPQAKSLHDQLKIWIEESGPVYDLVTDPISAPKNIRLEKMNELLELAQEMKMIDISIARELIFRIKRPEVSHSHITQILLPYRERLRQIRRIIIEFYKTNGLLLSPNTNIRI